MCRGSKKDRSSERGRPFKRDHYGTHFLETTFYWCRYFVNLVRRSPVKSTLRQAFDKTVEHYKLTAGCLGFTPRKNIICFSTVKKKYKSFRESTAYCLYIQTLRSGLGQRGRTDSLRVNAPISTKETARSMLSDISLIEDTVILSGFGLFFYAYWVKNLHSRPHGTVEKLVLPAGVKKLSDNGVRVRVVNHEEIESGVLVIPDHDLTIFSHNHWSIACVSDFFFGSIVKNLVRWSKMDRRSSRCASMEEDAINISYGFGFRKSYSKGGTVHISPPERLNSESLRGIRLVGECLQQVVMSRDSEAFQNHARSLFVTKAMNDLFKSKMDMWNWEYIDVLITSSSKLIRHCDYVSQYSDIVSLSCLLKHILQNNDSRKGYEHCCVFSYPFEFRNRSFKVSLIYVTRHAVGLYV